LLLRVIFDFSNLISKVGGINYTLVVIAMEDNYEVIPPFVTLLSASVREFTCSLS
jgi:hypothetical protein